MAENGFDWKAHPDVEKQLKELWSNQALTASQVAIEMGKLPCFGGKKLTRNMILGKVHRMGLNTHRQKVIVRKQVPPRPHREPKVIPPEEPQPLLEGGVFAAHKCCQYIHGDPSQRVMVGGVSTPAWKMCGHPVKPGKTYCEWHYAKCVDLVRMEAVKRSSRGS